MKTNDGTSAMDDFQVLRKNVNKIIKLTKKEYYHDLFTKCFNNSKKMWEVLNTLARNKVQNNNVTIPKLLLQTGPITEGNEVCEVFNQFFATIGSTLASEIPNKYHASSDDILMYANDHKHDILLTQFRICTRDEVSKIIDALDTNTSTGIDGVSTKAIKCIKTAILQSLTSCINKCLSEGTFPDSLKIAKVSPIYKSGTKTDPGNYRPISVLPIMSKIFERIIYSRLFEYLNDKKFFCENQYGFRPGSSTLSATVDLVTKVKTNMDRKMIALGIFIDLKKAFDTISHQTD
jgi:hypothetical protein